MFLTRRTANRACLNVEAVEGLALAGSSKHVITVGSASYSAYNECMMASLLGHRLDMTVCKPEVPRGDRFDRRALQSGFTGDADGADGDFLRSSLRGLI